MPIIGLVSQKGGVGKSTLARGLAVLYAGAGWTVKIGDLDAAQKTSTDWLGLRIEANLKPLMDVGPYGTVGAAVIAGAGFDLLLLDSKPGDFTMALEIAKAADLVLLPTNTSLDDLRPTIRLAHQLKARGIDQAKLLFVLNNTNSAVSAEEARAMIVEHAGFAVTAGDVPNKFGYQLAQSRGRSITETTHASLNSRATAALKEIVGCLQQLTSKRGKR